MLVLFTDTNTDVTPSIAKEYGYNLISMPYTIDEKDTYPYVDYTEYDYQAFYNTLRGGVLPKTSAISPATYVDYFEPHFKAGNDILYVHFSAAMSGTFNSLKLALEMLKEKYPERKFYQIDTKFISIGGLCIAREVGRLYKENKTIEEILEWADKEVDRFALYFYADDLKFFKRSGRISNFSATMGTIIGIHPIIHVDDQGVMTTIAKERGRKKALNKVMEYVETLADDIYNHPVLIAHSDSLELAEKLRDMLVEKYGSELQIEFSVVNPTIGSHCGPNAIGVCFHAKHR